jgi:hypothetical protein
LIDTVGGLHIVEDHAAATILHDCAHKGGGEGRRVISSHDTTNTLTLTHTTTTPTREKKKKKKTCPSVGDASHTNIEFVLTLLVQHLPGLDKVRVAQILMDFNFSLDHVETCQQLPQPHGRHGRRVGILGGLGLRGVERGHRGPHIQFGQRTLGKDLDGLGHKITMDHTRKEWSEWEHTNQLTKKNVSGLLVNDMCACSGSVGTSAK